MVPTDSGAARTAAFLQLYSAHARRLYSYALTLVPNSTDAEDIFQEASRVLWEKFDEFIPGTDFYAWSCRTVHYQALWQRRQQQRSRLQFSDDFLAAVTEQATSDLESLEAQHRALAECLEKLTPGARELVGLRFQPGATTESVAKRLGKSVDAVYKALNRAEQFLLDCTHRAFGGQTSL